MMVHTDANSRDLEPPRRQRSTRELLDEAGGRGRQWDGADHPQAGAPDRGPALNPSLLPDGRWDVASASGSCSMPSPPR